MLDPPRSRSEPVASLGEPTLLFTDIEGSTRLLAALGDVSYAEVLAQHHQLIRDALGRHAGLERSTEGDSFFATFDNAEHGVGAAVDAQRALADAAWPTGVDLRVRMGLHTGPVALVGGNLVGMAIHAASRIESAAHGGQIVVSAPIARVLDGRDDLRMRSLGSHRLRGITERMELYQVGADGLSDDFPPLASEPSDAVPVPRFLATFVGREDELLALGQLLEHSRIVTITGPPGVGKTRLASALLEGRGDVAFVDLAAIDETSQVEERVASAVGVRPSGDEAALFALVRHLRDVSYHLVIDNCEHVVDEVARVVTELVVGTTQLRVVATSREPLAVDGEVVWPLEPLREAEALFVTRVRAADATSTLRADDPRVVAICERVDRLPLAVELAAAQVGRIPLDEVVARLDDLVRQLRSGRRDVPARHRTLRAAIDGSVRLLDPREHSAFRRLAVMRGAFDLAVAEVVTDESADVIAALHERSLLSVGTQETSGRFRMLQTIRDAALELLAAAGETDEATAAHARAFQDRATSQLHGTPTHFTTLRAIEADADNYRQAVEWLALNDPVAALGLAVDLEVLWNANVPVDRARRLLADILERSTDAPSELRASGLLMVADIDRNAGRVTDARQAAQEAFDLVGDRATRDRYTAPVVLGQILALQGELDAAERLFAANLRTNRERGDAQATVAVLRELANVAIERGRPEDAVTPLDEATDLALTHEESRWMLGILASDRGRAALALGRVDEARAEFEAAMVPVQELGIGRAIAGCSLGLAQVGRVAGDAERSRPLLQEAFRFYRDQGDTGGLAHAFVEAGLRHGSAGEHEAAVRLLAAAGAMRDRIQIATPGSEEPAIVAAWAGARDALDDETVKRLARSGRGASIDELGDLI